MVLPFPEPGEPSLGLVLPFPTSQIISLLSHLNLAVLIFDYNLGAISSLDPSTPLWVGACPPTVVPSVLSTFPTSPTNFLH